MKKGNLKAFVLVSLIFFFLFDIVAMSIPAAIAVFAFFGFSTKSVLAILTMYILTTLTHALTVLFFSKFNMVRSFFKNLANSIKKVFYPYQVRLNNKKILPAAEQWCMQKNKKFTMFISPNPSEPACFSFKKESDALEFKMVWG